MLSAKEPIKVVLDTNVSISAVLWTGIPHQLLKLAEQGSLKCYATIEMLNELEDVLRREKFAERIKKVDTSIEELMFGIINLVEIVKHDDRIKFEPHELPADEDDMMFIQCALFAEVHYIISSDDHILNLKNVRGIPILLPNIFYQKVQSKLLFKEL